MVPGYSECILVFQGKNRSHPLKPNQVLNTRFLKNYWLDALAFVETIKNKLTIFTSDYQIP